MPGVRNRLNHRTFGDQQLTMTDENTVKLVNQNGKIVGVDPKTGGEVPIKLGSGLGSDDKPVPHRSHFEKLGAEDLNNVPQVREQVTGGSGTEDDPYVIQNDILSDYTGLVNFGKGWFEVGGLATDASNDHSEESAYLQGDGIRTTTLHHSSDTPSTPTVLFQADDSGGNFGGIRDMTVYGAGRVDKSGTANIVESDGNTIDLQFENVIIRYGGGDALHIEVSASGTRVVNAWLENVQGHALYLGGGTRPKLSNIHIIGTGDDAIHAQCSYSQANNITVIGAGGNNGIYLTSARHTQWSNIYLDEGLEYGIRTTSTGTEGQFTNVYINDCRASGMQLAGSSHLASNIYVSNWGSDYGYGIRCFADSSRIYNLFSLGFDSGYSPTILRLENTKDVYVNGVGGVGDEVINIQSDAVECVIDNVFIDYSNIDDNGTRTLVNRWGTNDGDPNSTGEWNGHADYAGAMKATIWDTSTSPWTGYHATPNGSDWVAIS